MQKIKRLFLLAVALLLLDTAIPSQKLYAADAGIMIAVAALGGLGLVALGVAGVVTVIVVYHAISEDDKATQIKIENQRNDPQNASWAVYLKDGTVRKSSVVIHDRQNGFRYLDEAGTTVSVKQDLVNFVKHISHTGGNSFTYTDSSVLRTSGTTLSIGGIPIPIRDISVRYSIPLPLCFEVGLGVDVYTFNLFEHEPPPRMLSFVSDIRWYPFSREPKDFFMQAEFSAGAFLSYIYKTADPKFNVGFCLGWKFEWHPVFLTTSIGISKGGVSNSIWQNSMDVYSGILRCEFGFDFSTIITPSAYIASNYK